MKHDFENARRGAVIEGTGKTRVTMYLDDDVIEHFRECATKNGRGYQTEINAVLRTAMMATSKQRVLTAHSKAGDADKIMAALECRLAELSKTVNRVEKGVVFVQRYVAQGTGQVGTRGVAVKGAAKQVSGHHSGDVSRRKAPTNKPHKTA